MSSYHVGIQDLKFLVDGFVDRCYLTRKGAVNWIKENKDLITPEFMQGVKESPDAFFYRVSHLEEDVDDFSLLELFTSA